MTPDDSAVSGRRPTRPDPPRPVPPLPVPPPPVAAPASTPAQPARPSGGDATRAATSADPNRFTHWAFVCHASDCRYRGAPALSEALARALQEQGAQDVAVVRSGCLSLCGAGPALVTYPRGEVLLHVEPADASELAVHLANGQGLPRRTVRAPKWYKDHILGRLAVFVQLLHRRHAQPTG